MRDFNFIAKNLTFHEKGFWMPATASEAISYPEDGNELCAEIEDHSFWFKHRNNVIIEGLKNYPVPNGAFFDVGGGNGYVSKGLIEAGIDCLLIEPGMKGAARAVERGVKNVICATLESAGLEKHSISGVGLFDVVEHIEDDKGFLENIRSFMQPQGRVYITVPAYNFLWSNEDVYAGHFRRYTLSSISDVLAKAGFSIEYATYFFSFLPPGIFLLRSLPSLLGKKQRASVEESRKQHQTDKSGGNGILNKLLEAEIKRIRAKKVIPFGGSCFVVAKS